MQFRRVVLVILDSLGVGEAPDASLYGDQGSDTLGHVAQVRPLRIPHLRSLGLAHTGNFQALEPCPEPLGAYGRCAPASPGKDTTTGHWEIAGIHLEAPFPVYPNGFPPEVMDEFCRRTGRGFLGNVPASGTEIIAELGEEHLRTGKPIVYTSADSVFQIAAHEEIIPPEELYRICQVVRQILQGPHRVGRVIARPFTGKPGAFVRTGNRRDFAVPPPPGMLLDRLADKGVPVFAVGKIAEIFLDRGITRRFKTRNNAEGMSRILEAFQELEWGLLFANLVDFDQLYGHRNDPEGYARALESFDEWLPNLLKLMGPGDALLITADHGCDPTTPSTDHSREYVPILAYGERVQRNVNLGIRTSLSDIGQTIAANFQTTLEKGVSFLEAILCGHP